MIKRTAAVLLTCTVLLAATPATSEAKNLRHLLGAQRPVATSTATPGENGAGSRLGSQRHDRVRHSADTADNLHHRTPIFPVLNKLIKLYLLWLLFNPYR